MFVMNGYNIFSLLWQQVVLARELASSREYASKYWLLEHELFKNTISMLQNTCSEGRISGFMIILSNQKKPQTNYLDGLHLVVPPAFSLCLFFIKLKF